MHSDDRYQQTLDYLYSFVDYSLSRAFQYAPVNFELGRMVDFMRQFGEPWRVFPILHVAGTKGKGSVATLCATALQAGGYRVGLYTSPHLEDYAERIQVDGQPIEHAELVTLVDEIRPYLNAGTKLTTFEITTGLAMIYFARRGVNAAVLEVGLGGRLDATNIVTPAVSVITSISYDHTHILGDTLAKIAFEKAGIIKPGVPVVISPQVEEARRVFEEVCSERGAPLVQVGRDVSFAGETSSLGAGQTLVVSRPDTGGSALVIMPEAVHLTIPLLGAHQVENAATAYAALKVAAGRGLPISDEAIQTGFTRAAWPARFEILQNEPPLVIDCAHNRDSALKLRQALDEFYPDREVILVFGASDDKDVAGMFAELMPRVRRLVLTRSYHPRAMPPEELLKLAEPFGKPVHVVAEVEEALSEALRLAGSPEGKPAIVLAAGSIFVAAGVRQAWGEHRQR